ncbi:MAG: helix-turn-helix domain-containing protein, partial [Chloroflexota bacterium]
HLRKKLEEDVLHPRYIETLRGVGYRFNPRFAQQSGG